jgi:hypothetical protein
MDRIVARGGMCIFTDGSGYEGGVGSAAVATKGRTLGARRWKHLGEEADHAVFESEVVGAILALDIVAVSNSLPPRCAPIALSRSPSPTSSSHAPHIAPTGVHLITRIGTARLSLRKLLSSKSDAAPVLAFVRDTGRLPTYTL